MAYFRIESLKSPRPEKNQDWSNAASIYPAILLTTG